MRFFIPLLTTLLLLTTSCQEQKANKSEEQMKQVMALHDEVMPKMSTISTLVAELKPLADSLGTESEYHSAMTDLQEAHHSMMDWMKGFGERFTPDEIMNGAPLSEEKTKWLDEEETKMEEVKLKMESSIDRAKQLLKKP